MHPLSCLWGWRPGAGVGLRREGGSQLSINLQSQARYLHSPGGALETQHSRVMLARPGRLGHPGDGHRTESSPDSE